MCSLCSLLTINTLLKGKFYTHHLPHVWCRLLIDDCTSHELAGTLPIRLFGAASLILPSPNATCIKYLTANRHLSKVNIDAWMVPAHPKGRRPISQQLCGKRSLMTVIWNFVVWKIPHRSNRFTTCLLTKHYPALSCFDVCSLLPELAAGAGTPFAFTFRFVCMFVFRFVILFSKAAGTLLAYTHVHNTPL